MNDDPTIFLVDDDPAALRALTALIKVVFPRVKPFLSADEFLAAYREHQPGCLVLDVAMPGMNGLELHRKLIRDKITLPVIYVTGHGNVPMAVEAMQMKAVNFLEKPVQEQCSGTAFGEAWSWTSKIVADGCGGSVPKSGLLGSPAASAKCST